MNIEKGDLFASKDRRDRGRNRIIRVVSTDTPSMFKPVTKGRDDVLVETVEHWNEKLIGRHFWIHPETLRTKFERVSH